MVHRDVRTVLDRLVTGQRRVLGEDLVGSYLFGSAATGDFQPGVSDVDTIAVLRADPNAVQLHVVGRLHDEIAQEMPEWQGLIEAVYLSAHALQRFRSGVFPAARIAPGEPFHAIDVDDRWLIDWYQVRRVGITLTGPPASSVVPPIPQDEWARAVRRHLLEWPEDDAALEGPGDLAYAIVSMCRGLRAVRSGEHVSKEEGARWASVAMPDHTDLIAAALSWRARPSDGSVLGGPARDETRRFISEVKRAVERGFDGPPHEEVL
jgi:hypothetical protein